jgi:hypothetical protein
MDNIRASEAPDSGSIPDEVTKEVQSLRFKVWYFEYLSVEN